MENKAQKVSDQQELNQNEMEKVSGGRTYRARKMMKGEKETVVDSGNDSSETKSRRALVDAD